MRAAYLNWIQGLLNNPIIAGQVIELLMELRRHLRGIEKLYLISFQPWYIHLIRRNELAGLRKRLEKEGICLVIIPVIYHHKWFNAKWYQIPLILAQSFPVLLYFSVVKKVRLFHCRSYPITFPAIAVKCLRDTRIVFDPRSDFPEENVTAGRWKHDSLSYKVWKWLERVYLNKSDMNIAIASTYVEHYRRISPNAPFAIIPNNVDVEKFKRDDSFRQQFREAHNVTEDEILFCFCGSLGTWHKPELYARYIAEFRGLDIKHRFLFITPQVDLLEKVFGGYGIASREYFALHSSFSEVPKYLSAADFGMFVMGHHKIAMAVKTPEYLSVGLPVIANSNAAGAKEVVEKYGVGIVCDLNSGLEKLEQFVQEFMQRRQELSAACREVALRLFSNESAAQSYAIIYQDLLQNMA